MQDLIQTLTADLRLSLLVLGAVVITVLIFWELWQRWRARKADASHITGPDDVDDVLVREMAASPEGMETEVSTSAAVGTGGKASAGRANSLEPSHDSVELPSMSARDDFDDRWASLVSERDLGTPAQDSKDSAKEVFEDDDLPDEGVIGTVREVTQARAEQPVTEPSSSSDSSTMAAPSPTSTPLASSAASLEQGSVAPASEALSLEAPKVRIEWPPEDQRRVVGLRIVGRGGERFTGASLRQALQGEGFVFGEMEIFHRPVADGRVVMSAASLTQPGTFNPDTMDASLFRGLNLFAVLPGPLPGREAVDKLLLVGHTLAQRVRGELQDGRGQALTEARLAEMRREAGSASG